MAMFNPKADKKVFCWLCDHFQRFDEGSEPESCVGECRLSPPGQFLGSGYGSSSEHWIQLWPLIEDPVGTWCGSFERSLEQNIPPHPEECGTNPCGPRVYDWQPWNKKKPENVFCWTCDHFARFYEDPSTVTSFDKCLGWCRHNPPAPYTFFGFSQSTEGQMIGTHWALIGPAHWCSQWEQATFPVPPMPQDCDQEPSMIYAFKGSPQKQCLKILRPEPKETSETPTEEKPKADKKK